ncbi:MULTISPECIES: hypothetical protein [unclassified Mesorhizobium]|uniref:hypothetical protein n=2 Tax=Mesorhizobium TaxID=68287 RepID=UPI000FC9A935|nr:MULTISPECIES: hypothetical protein [unclassified Mesorhizobium]RUU06273.1 hypothetical protein EOD12_00340 [Mesorhizobium sp. M7A.T.Ca.TU.009.02.1.1]RUU91257.1 hypothetical protein EOD03_00080 [Mesorhizobium sp. M7A.T.Ca.TU.009.01.1.2]RUX05093.1 hypothetical protein EOA35_08635 [Mesorhizobium sp. M8A.F.Ca.ET.023.01.1.1]RVD55079.1 hypothetical protein EN746_06065 [Mesorhizobium sp. M8A.F.Ca.ET.023.02.2.1]TGR36796.1 hypothetical protein EN842_52770 [bacterium M00.F.Ca.ET.199.01.1.1]TGU17602.
MGSSPISMAPSFAQTGRRSAAESSDYAFPSLHDLAQAINQTQVPPKDAKRTQESDTVLDEIAENKQLKAA